VLPWQHHDIDDILCYWPSVRSTWLDIGQVIIIIIIIIIISIIIIIIYLFIYLFIYLLCVFFLRFCDRDEV